MCRGFIIPKEIRDPEAISRFLDAVGQAESIIRESGLIGIRRLTTEEILGDEKTPGILNQYFTLNFEHSVNEDIKLDPGRMMIGDKILCMHTLTDLDDLPQQVGTDTRYERLSTDRSDCRLSFAAPVGLLLGCDHVYNQFIFLENHEEILERFERMGRNMNSLSQYSRSNAVNKEWIDLYLSEAHVGNLRSVRCHCNVMTWAENEDDLKRIRNDVGAQLALLGCTPHHNTVDVPALFWGAIPGNEADFPAEESFYTFLEPALCFFTAETNYRSSPSPFGIKMVDRHTGIPIHLDISDLPMKRGIIQNRNKCIVGPSGSGKSFITNHLVRQYWEQGAHIVLVDTGNSYKGLCELVNQKTHGKDGIYFTYTDENPICFNPFYTDDGIFDIEKRESIKTLILTLWKRENEPPTRAEEVALSNAVNLYLAELRKDSELIPSFNTFYEFVGSDYRRLLRQKNVREKDFDVDGFLNVLEPYWKIQCKLPPKTKRFCPLKTFNNAPLKSLDRWGYYYFSLFPSVCSHFTDTFSCQLNPVRRMYNTIHNGICYCRVSDCIIPIVRWQLRGDDDGLAPMSVLYYIEQDGSFLGIKVHKEEVIQYEQRAPFDSLEFRFQCAFYFCHLKRTHKFRSIRIICPYALLAGFIPHCCGKEALPGTG